jgi:hypothetical protein
MSYPIGYYTGYNPATQQPGILHQLQEQYGSQLEGMSYEQKIVMRAALADYIANKPVHQPSPHPDEVTLIDMCIESAGVNWGIWDEDEPLAEAIQNCAWLLGESDIEGLIAALSEQIRNQVYASRSV